MRATAVDLIRSRETGGPYSGRMFERRFTGSRAAGLALIGEVERLGSSGQPLLGMSTVCALTGLVQGPSGEAELPTLLCGSAGEHSVLQVGLQRPASPIPNNGNADPRPKAELPGAYELAKFRPRRGYHEGYSPITSLVPICSDRLQCTSLVAASSLGGGGMQAQFSILSIGVKSYAHTGLLEEQPRNSISTLCNARFRGTIWCADVRRDGREAALGTNCGTVVYRIGEGMRSISTGQALVTRHSDVLSQMYSPWDDNALLRGQRNGSISLLDTRCQDGETRVQVQMRASSSVTSIRFMQQGWQYALAASLDGAIGQWDLRMGKQVMSFSAHHNSHKPFRMDLSRDLLAAPGDDGRLRIWSLGNLSRGGGRRPLRDVTLKPGTVASACAFSPEEWLGRWAWAPALWCATDCGLAAIGYTELEGLGKMQTGGRGRMD